MCSAYDIAKVHQFPRNSVMEFQNICNEMVAPVFFAPPCTYLGYNTSAEPCYFAFELLFNFIKMVWFLLSWCRGQWPLNTGFLTHLSLPHVGLCVRENKSHGRRMQPTRYSPALVQGPNFTGRYRWPWHLIALRMLHRRTNCKVHRPCR